MGVLWGLFLALGKMYVRQKEALIWNILLPLFMIGLFAFVDFGGLGRIRMGVIHSSNDESSWFLDSLRSITTLEVHLGDRDSELQMLGLGERDAVVEIPPLESLSSSGQVTMYTNEGKPEEARLGRLILQNLLDAHTIQSLQPESRPRIVSTPVRSRNLTYIDYLLPGILSMSIMQTGIFGVAFGFVGFKRRGIFRRLWVTPIRPVDFIFAQVGVRLIVLMVQVSVMVGCGILFFDLHFTGSLADMFVVGLLGGAVFLAIGFAISGVSKTEDQVAPIANLVTLPMILLGGIFFEKGFLPGFVRAVTDLFPLTFLADALRTIAIDGSSLPDVGPQLLGLGVWSIVSIFLAVRLFRWE